MATKRITAKATLEDRKVAAQAIYEGHPGATAESVALEVGVSPLTVTKWVRENKWVSATARRTHTSPRAIELTQQYKAEMQSMGHKTHDPQAAAEVGQKLAEQVAVDVRTAVLDRHKKEWAAPRQIAYKAAQAAAGKDVDGALKLGKLAKTLAETIAIIQHGEARAYGIGDEFRVKEAHVIIVERDGMELPQLTPPSLSDAGELPPAGVF